MKKRNYTLIATLVAGSLFSFLASADTRANNATSAETVLFVGQSWLMPAQLDGQSLQNKKVRVKVVSEVEGNQEQ